MPSSALSFLCSNSFLICSNRLFNAENERESVVVVVDSGMPDSSWCPRGWGKGVNEERKGGEKEQGRREGVRKERKTREH